MAKFKDYDALAADKETFTFRVGGRDFQLPPELPARLMMDMANAEQNDDAQAESIGMRIITDTVGAENWEYILDHMGHKGLEMFLVDVLSFYGLSITDEEEGDDLPKAEDPQSESENSSNTGEPSILTSNSFGLIPGGLSTPANSHGSVSSVG